MSACSSFNVHLMTEQGKGSVSLKAVRAGRATTRRAGKENAPTQPPRSEGRENTNQIQEAIEKIESMLFPVEGHGVEHFSIGGGSPEDLAGGLDGLRDDQEVMREHQEVMRKLQGVMREDIDSLKKLCSTAS